MSTDKDKIKEVIESMLDGFDKEHIESPMYKHLIEKSEYLKDPDTMQTMILHPFIRCVELAISKTQNKKNVPIAIYKPKSDAFSPMTFFQSEPKVNNEKVRTYYKSIKKIQ